MYTDTISDTLTRIRNGGMAGHKTIQVRCSKMVKSVLEVLKSEGFIVGYEEAKDKQDKFDMYDVNLRYIDDGRPVISEAIRVSRPGRRVYAKSTELPRVHRGLGIAIISTSQGVMPDRLARKNKVGGEVLAYIN